MARPVLTQVTRRGLAPPRLALPSADLEQIFAVVLLLTAGQIAQQARKSPERP